MATVQFATSVESRPRWSEAAVAQADCSSCGIAKAGSSVVPGIGPDEAKYVLIGEALGRNEVLQGKPFVGKAGQLLSKCLEALGIDRERECFVTNACICQPPGNRSPTAAEAAACYPRLVYELDHLRAKQLIITLGNTSTRVVLGSEVKEGIRTLRGRRFWSDRFGCHVLPTYHPAAVLRQTSLFDDFVRDLQKAPSIAALPPGPATESPPVVHVVSSVAEALALFELVRVQPIVACDTETEYIEYGSRVLSLGFCWELGHVWIVPAALLETKLVQLNLQALFESKPPRFIWHNGKFDAERLYAALGLRARVDEDTLLMHYAVDEREWSHGLKLLAREYFDAPNWEEDIKIHLPNKNAPYSTIPSEVLFQYQAFDCDYTLRLYDRLRRELEAEDTERPYRELLVPATNIFVEIETRGVPLDIPYLEQLRGSFVPRLETLASALHDRAVELGLDPNRVPRGRLNPNSPLQLQVVVYDLLGCPPFEGAKTTAQKALEAYKDRDPFFGLLLEWRHVSKLNSVYVEGFLERADPEGRIHTDYILFGTVTGRLASRNPNLQNVPGWEDTIRRAFIASSGYRFVECDYSQLELRTVAYLSQEPVLLNVFASGGDIHREIASKVFRKPADEITKEERKFVKPIVFGTLYGRGPHSLATGELQCTVEEAQGFIDRFFEGLPKLHEWMELQRRLALERGYVETPFGRRRRFPFIHPDTIHEIQRQAVNMPVQSTASDICLGALIRVHHALRERDWGWVLFTVHDSIAFEFREEMFDEAVALVREIMEYPVLTTDVRWRVEAKTGPNWWEATPI